MRCLYCGKEFSDKIINIHMKICDKNPDNKIDVNDEEIENLSYKELQELAIKYDIQGNQKKKELIKAIKEVI